MSFGECYADLPTHNIIYPRNGLASIKSDGRRFEIVDETGMSSILLIDHNAFGARVVSPAPGLVEIHRLSEIPRSTSNRPAEIEAPAPYTSHRDLLEIMKMQILGLLADHQERLIERLSELKSIPTGPQRMREAIIAEPKGGLLRSLIAQKELDRIRAESQQGNRDAANEGQNGD